MRIGRKAPEQLLKTMRSANTRMHPTAAARWRPAAARCAGARTIDELWDMLAAGRSGFAYTLASIAFVLVGGALLGRAFGVPKRLAYLISVGIQYCKYLLICLDGKSNRLLWHDLLHITNPLHSRLYHIPAMAYYCKYC